MNRNLSFAIAAIGLGTLLAGSAQAQQIDPRMPLHCGSNMDDFIAEIKQYEGISVLGEGVNHHGKRVAILGHQAEEQARKTFAILAERDDLTACMETIGHNWINQTNHIIVDVLTAPEDRACMARTRSLIANTALGYDHAGLGITFDKKHVDFYTHPETHNWIISATQMLNQGACLLITDRNLEGTGWNISANAATPKPPALD